MAGFESCNKCKFDSKSAHEFPCCDCIHNAREHFKPKSNADRIRSFSDREMAEFLIGFVNTFGEEYEGALSCLEWLKSEAKE